jgi:GAF domain-containing protein
MSYQADDSARLQDLLGAFHAGAMGREETHSSVLDVILERIACDRVSMWRLDGAGPSLLRFAAKSSGGHLELGEQRLEAADYAPFFKILLESGTYVSRDTACDPVVQPLRARYLAPDRVASLLDAAFLLNNRAYGMVCCEATRPRDWAASEVFALRAICNRIALLMWTAPDSVLRTSPWLAVRPPPSPAPAAPPEWSRRR